ncbi:hypothetical protein BB558_001628 [Smittium angustum]|uniref:V-type proton ATPase subunit C n=1 Tax=Smittium angustum TaxID=133377 RepID=A0A2U1JB48_SMIAN|nr:hypothetical protein BB558_001628 [Smittium angustum]
MLKSSSFEEFYRLVYYDSGEYCSSDETRFYNEGYTSRDYRTNNHSDQLSSSNQTLQETLHLNQNIKNFEDMERVKRKYVDSSSGYDVDNENSVYTRGKRWSVCGKVYSEYWKNQDTIVYNLVSDGRVLVSRRKDNNMVNGTKLINLSKEVSRGKRDGILKKIRSRIVVKDGNTCLKGIWVSLNVAKRLAYELAIQDEVYPLLESNLENKLFGTEPFEPGKKLSKNKNFYRGIGETPGYMLDPIEKKNAKDIRKKKEMVLFWLISIPAEGNSDLAWNELRSQVETNQITRIEIPSFKIGSLDGLLKSSEDLVKLDNVYEITVNRVAETITKLSMAHQDEYNEYFFVEDYSVEEYIKKFSWDISKYQAGKGVSEILEKISEASSVYFLGDNGSIQETLKSKMKHYNSIKSSVNSITKKNAGNLSKKPLDGVVQKEHCIEGSEFLKTVFVAVPVNQEREWYNCYETLCQMVVPRSTKKIAGDSEYLLFSVVIFNRVVGDFTTAAREKKFVVREYEFSEKEEEGEDMAAKIREEQETLARQQRYMELLEWAQTSFSDVFSAWVHIKVVRVFVESVLRYGLPPDFVCGVLEVAPKIQKQLKKKLGIAYSRLDSSGRLFGVTERKSRSGAEGVFDMSEFNGVLEEYTPFVGFDLNWSYEGNR